MGLSASVSAATLSRICERTLAVYRLGENQFRIDPARVCASIHNFPLFSSLRV